MRKLILFATLFALLLVGTGQTGEKKVGRGFINPDGSFVGTKTECFPLGGYSVGSTTENFQPQGSGNWFTGLVTTFSGTANESVTYYYRVPRNYAGGAITVNTAWMRSGSGANAPYCFQLTTSSVAEDATWNEQVATGTPATDSKTSVRHVLDEFETTIATPGWTACRSGLLEVERDPQELFAGCSGLDTLGQDVNLLYAEVCYEADNVFSGEGCP